MNKYDKDKVTTETPKATHSTPDEQSSSENSNTKKPTSRRKLYLYIVIIVLLIITRNAYYNNINRTILIDRFEQLGGNVQIGCIKTKYPLLNTLLIKIYKNRLLGNSVKFVNMLELPNNQSKAFNEPFNNDFLRELNCFKSLNILYLQNTATLDVALIANFKNLTRLYLRNNQISDLSSLNKLASLSELSITDNQVSDLTPLKGLMFLQSLNLKNNKITDLTPLSEVHNLIHLNIENNPDLTIVEINKLQKVLPQCKITHNATK